MLELKISEEDIAAVDELVSPSAMVSRFYEADSGPYPYRVPGDFPEANRNIVTSA